MRKHSTILFALMVFIYPRSGIFDTGIVAIRSTGSYAALLIIEAIVGLIVALSNLAIIFTLVIGWRRLMKNNFYIILANAILCTSLKAFVELGFIIPYYVMQFDGVPKKFGYFHTQYEFLIFNISVLADYGVLYFSVLIALNRYLVVLRNTAPAQSSLFAQRIKTVFSCGIVWICTIIIPGVFYYFECQYVYKGESKVYQYQCLNARDGVIIWVLIDCLAYISYTCAAFVLLLYLLIVWSLRKQRILHTIQPQSSMTSVQRRLLKQSATVFVLYAASILCVFAMSTAIPGQIFAKFEIAYIENLLNLSIAAVYPISFLAMSGEMKSLLIKKFMPTGSWLVSSVRISSSNNQNSRNEVT